MPRDVGSYQQLGERHGTDFPSEPPEGNNPADSLSLDFWTPEPGENKRVLLSAARFVVICYSSATKLILGTSTGSCFLAH